MAGLQPGGSFALIPRLFHFNIVIVKISNGRGNIVHLVCKMEDAGIDSLLALLV
jgi:hypothetical protein